jgi:predicted transposase YbfD/YdcC
MSTGLWEHFAVLPDPRMERTRKHKLEDILTVTICAVICGAEGWNDIELFGESKEAWFRTFLDLPHGIPSHDTFGRVLAALDPDAFERAFQAWVTALKGSSAGKHVAIDGKAIRRSLDRASGKACIHLVSAWVCEDHTVFGQLAVDDKSNEITAIPKLIEMLNLKKAVVTIDAIGCQTEIARKIREKGGDYVLSLKENQGTLHEDVTLFLDDARTRDFTGVDHDFWEETEKGHGRIETRRVWCTGPVNWLTRRHENWAGLRSLAMVEASRQAPGEAPKVERRYFISSLPGDSARKLGQVVREHWGVESRLHWSLDVCFGEDQSRARIGNAAQNLSRVRRIALTLLKQERTIKVGIKGKRLNAGWDAAYLLRVLEI